MKKRLGTLMAMFFGALATVCAQMPMMNYRSTVVNPDGSVTFSYRNDKARKVEVDVQFAGRHEMTRQSPGGLWTVTLGPAAPDMYPYCFVVDGVSIMDPKAEQYFPNEGFKNSLLEIGARDGVLPHDVRDVPHGHMEYVNYNSRSLGAVNNALVYLPPSYYKNTSKSYPVFYLISGTTDTEEVYYKVGRVNYILDNMIADGEAEEMIVVLPYGNPYKLLPAMPGRQMPMTDFGSDVFSNDLVSDLMPFVESRYRTINDRDHRAIGGFSRGGNQGLSNGLRNLDKFSYLCSYSSFTSTDIPDVYDHARDTNRKLHLFWLGVGTDDFLYGNARDYTEFLDKKGIRCVKEYTTDKFGHTWMNAKYFLSRTLRLLFNPEASAKAMKAAGPTMKKTGQEKQFTPGVMARLFPKAVVSPLFEGQDVSFFLKADNAKTVELEYELGASPVRMTKGEDGLWSVRLAGMGRDVFKYCFVVDGTRVADPSNMYLSPDRGFKYSISRPIVTDSPDMAHGTVQYDYAAGTALYYPATGADEAELITLIPGAEDTEESWFKVGCADDIADRLIAKGVARTCSLRVAKQPLGRERVLRAADFATWKERSEALAKMLCGETVVPLVSDARFNATVDGKQTGLYTIGNGKVYAQITNYGGFVVSLLSPDRYGNYANLVNHYNSVEEYTHYNMGFAGPALGRYANRIGNARFVLDGKEYNLTKNSREHILHGGKKGFDHTVWDVVSHDANSLVLRCVLADGEDGFPGRLATTLTYVVAPDGGLSISYEAQTDKPTVVNLSNHTYFNLDGMGAGDILDHSLEIKADCITETSREGIPTGKMLQVAGTPYDFRRLTRIGERQMKLDGFVFGKRPVIPEGMVMNFDNNFCLSHSKADTVEKVAVLRSPRSGRVLEVWNNHPGLQVYTGARTAIALESQMYPDSPNHPEFPSTVLRPGQTYRHTCVYKLSLVK